MKCALFRIQKTTVSRDSPGKVRPNIFSSRTTRISLEASEASFGWEDRKKMVPARSSVIVRKRMNRTGWVDFALIASSYHRSVMWKRGMLFKGRLTYFFEKGRILKAN